MTSSDSTIAAISDTTADGRVFYNDLVFDDLHGELFRTDRVGMDIIREINADRKRQKRLADSLKVENSLLEQKYSLCDSSKQALNGQKNVLKFQLDIRQEMIDNYEKQNDLSDTQIKRLNRKVNIGKIGWSVGGIFIGATIILGTLLYIK